MTSTPAHPHPDSDADGAAVAHWILDADNGDELAGPYQDRRRAIDTMSSALADHPWVTTVELVAVVDGQTTPTGWRLTRGDSPAH